MSNALASQVQLVVLAGDMATYPLAREMHEAYGTSTVCVVPIPIAAIKHSNFIEWYAVDDMEEASLAAALTDIAQRDSAKRVIVMVNQDLLVERLERIQHQLPANVHCALAPHEIAQRVSDKIEFAKLCAEFGLDAPRSEVVNVAAGGDIAPTKIAFPLIAKPAVSSDEYVRLYPQGFKKVYFIQSQAELDQLWADLRSVNFTGDFLVQELIGGDDTYVDMLTAYVNKDGKVTMLASAQVLLEDHAPNLFGNPVAMITRPMPELWDKVSAMLTAIGWRGFANFDMKRDPKTGRVIFMDFNPRIGCNSYYACAGGINPMRALVEDVLGAGDEVQRLHRTALYTRGPASLVRRYVLDPALRAEFDGIVRAGAVHNPMRYAKDSVRSRFFGWLMERNYIRKFKRYYPEVTDTAF